jgi:hypothetical protein
MGRLCSTHENLKNASKFWLEIFKEKYHVGEFKVGERIILKWILTK